VKIGAICVLVAATSRGVCAVKMGSSDSALRHDLQREFSAATLVADDEALAEWTRAILGRLEPGAPRGRLRADGASASRAAIDLPLDIQATAFQWQVWQALTAIPYGETRTYGDIASAIGRPKAVRAVARACATNPVALAIPCHRVVPAAGGEGGYRWGPVRKRALLQRERAARAGKAG